VSRTAVAANPSLALLVAIDIATWAGQELRPAALERPVGWWLSGSRHARDDEKNEENYGNDCELNSAQSHLTLLLSDLIDK